ncbi:Vfa1 domain containing protein [Pyrenophora tritici-repentis]|nr:Vfa1 domain containing protein [Pyrenophora tritici-repentis]KAI1669831.1 Vfa1 domain containing protein [Pyrenophora tritici-repentis]KAI1681418.1 Vfa1 domain containing protein [Pyrenophora tritici-repentis]
MENIWHHRRVAENASKACWICYKPTTSVLITPNNKDFFYICAGHLSDRGFCLPEADEAKRVEEEKKKDELDREIEAVKKEYEEKQKIKREKRKGKDKEKDKEKEKEAKKKEDDEDKGDEKAKDEKIKELSKTKDQAQAEIGPRIYQLNKNFYQMRLDKLRNVEIAKRNRERLSNPANFPSVPSGNP